MKIDRVNELSGFHPPYDKICSCLCAILKSQTYAFTLEILERDKFFVELDDTFRDLRSEGSLKTSSADSYGPKFCGDV
jgi:hypothetical protein